MFTLALALKKTVGELVHGMSKTELRLWMAYNALIPIGPRRADLNAAMIAATIANVNRPPNKRGYNLEDFNLYKKAFKKESASVAHKADFILRKMMERQKHGT